jgi:hypothetical protein
LGTPYQSITASGEEARSATVPVPQRDDDVTVGLAGNAITVAVAAPEAAEEQVTPFEGAAATTVTDLVPAVAPLIVNVPLPVPLAVPAAPLHVYVAASTGEVTRNTTSSFWHTVAADTCVISGVVGNAATIAVAASEVADWQISVPYATCAYTVTDLAPAVAPLTV